MKGKKQLGCNRCDVITVTRFARDLIEWNGADTYVGMLGFVVPNLAQAFHNYLCCSPLFSWMSLIPLSILGKFVGIHYVYDDVSAIGVVLCCYRI
jgi:hypothetical protein